MSEGRQVLLLCLEDYSWLDDMYKGFMSNLHSKADVVKCSSTEAAHAALKSGSIPAVLVFEPAVMRPANQALGKALADYAKQGGTVVFACCCSSEVKPTHVDKFFARCFQLPWTTGEYYRTTFIVNPEAAVDIKAKIKKSYSMKASNLRNLARADLIYVTGPDSVRESMVPLFPDPMANAAIEGPVAFANYHNGKVGWVGDVNNEVETGTLVLAMLGV